jgi:hypothetical protein
VRDIRVGNLQAVAERGLEFRDRHPVLAVASSTAALTGAVVLAFWLLAGDNVGDTDMNVDVGLVLGTASAVLTFFFCALSALVTRRAR